MQYWFMILLKVLVTALVLALLVHQFDVRSTVHTLSTISPYAILGAIVALLAQSLAAAGRFAIVVARFGPRFALRDSYRLTLESMFFSQTFISFLGGDALRIWRIRRLGLALPKATSAVVLDRLIGTLVNHAFLLATLPWFLSSDVNSSIKIILVVLAVAGVTASLCFCCSDLGVDALGFSIFFLSVFAQASLPASSSRSQPLAMTFLRVVAFPGRLCSAL
jgi:uncharacterized membrane protein YbhN (UPF0104 family)